MVLLGDIPIATKAIKLLDKREDVTIVGVVCKQQKRKYHNDPWNEAFVYNYVKRKKMPIMTIADLIKQYRKNDLDVAFSCRNSIILRRPFIELFQLGVVNMHGGLLPERRGLNISCHCLIQGDSQGGGTLHYIDDEGIDTGRIISRKTFEIEDTDTSYSVFQKTQKCLWEAFLENIDSILSGSAEGIDQKKYIDQGYHTKYFSGASLDDYRGICLDGMSLEELSRRVRGFDFPGHQPAFVLVKGRKIYLTTREFFKNERK